MNKKIRWITETAVMLALLVALQAVTKPMGQLVTGSCVNAVLAVTVLLCGLSSGLTIAAVSPILAFLLGITPQIVTVPAIMVGNCVYVTLLGLLIGRRSGGLLWQMLVLALAAAAKFLTLYSLVVLLFCDALSESLMASGVLQAPMLQILPVNFGLLQLATALIGGAVALLLIPVLRKALRRKK